MLLMIDLEFSRGRRLRINILGGLNLPFLFVFSTFLFDLAWLVELGLEIRKLFVILIISFMSKDIGRISGS